MKRNLLFVVLGFVGLALLVGCSKTGPAGATGPAGSTGAAGPAGPQGPEGNANVLVDTLSLTSAQWLWNSQYSLETSPGGFTEYFTRYHTVTLATVTQGVLDSGMVMVYMVPDPLVNTTQWASLPYSFLDGSDNFFYFVGFQTYPGKVELDYFFQQVTSGATIPTLSNYTIPTYRFKIVVMTGKLATQLRQQGVDSTNYSQVSHFLNMP